ncbi:acyl carrier protein [Amycolatopsis sp. lyj-23]|uniref:acyl carrier protein n=1 Tax=Amycolatopsis sp. lyj-23 TaxID=2789283 RepID=UPI00397853FB
MSDRELTAAALRSLLEEVAGAAEGDGEFLDTAFDELGYDSLALMEAAGRIQREYGVALPDDLVAEADHPRAFLDLVNSRFAELV